MLIRIYSKSSPSLCLPLICIWCRNRNLFHLCSIQCELSITTKTLALPDFLSVITGYYRRWKYKKLTSDLSWATVCAELSSYQSQTGSILIYTGHCLIELAMAKFKTSQINQLNIQYSPFSWEAESTNSFSIGIFREISLLIDRQMICEIHCVGINRQPVNSS